jgi:NAD(P)-dependent dehydrogenase (short-subunit alcohol dehydrogenase family)
MKSLSEKTAAITGAGSGIGRALALRLSEEGCNLALSDINQQGLEATQDLLKSRPIKVHAVKVDVSDKDQVYAWAEQAAREFGQVDMVINNAGVAVYDRLENISYEDFNWLFNINFWGVVFGTRAFLPHLRKRPEAHIVNISSLNGMVPFPFNGPYNCAKFAVRGFNKTLVQELAGSNVRITSVHPGGIRTDIARNARFRKQNDQDLEHDDVTGMFARVSRMPAEEAARKIIKGVKKNRERLMIGIDAKVIDLSSRIAPVTTTKITGWVYRQMQKNLEAGRR